MITGRQIRAARALLDWSAVDLAEKSGLTRETVSRVEAGNVQARDETLLLLNNVFQENRIEFTDNDGVRFRPEGLEVLNGAQGIRKFFDSVYVYAQHHGGIMRQNGIEDTLFFKDAEDTAKIHRERMDTLKITNTDVVVRVLMREGNVDFQCPIYAEYKWFPRTAPMPVPYYVYGDTVGLFAMGEDAEPRIYHITSPVVSRTYAQQFDSAWDMANTPVKKKRSRS